MTRGERKLARIASRVEKDLAYAESKIASSEPGSEVNTTARLLAAASREFLSRISADERRSRF